MIRHTLIMSLLFVTCIFGLGGATCQSQNPDFQLPERARIFNASLRWHRFDDAAQCVLPKNRTHFLRAQKQRSRMIRYIDFEIVGVQKTTPTSAEVQVSLQSQHQQQTVIKQDFVRQTWEKVGPTWYVTKIKIIEQLAPAKVTGDGFGLD
jgi:hypothetical protein